MITIACHSCKIPVDIEDDDPNTEWECPTCSAAFLAQPAKDGTMHCVLTEESMREPDAQFIATPDIRLASPQSDPDIPDEIYVYALECLLKGTRPREIRKCLIESGYSAKQADKILQTAITFQKDKELEEKALEGMGGHSGQRNMLVGGIICVVGIVVTLGSMSMANESGGGRHVIAWGAIVFGAIQFFRGFSQSGRS